MIRWYEHKTIQVTQSAEKEQSDLTYFACRHQYLRPKIVLTHENFAWKNLKTWIIELPRCVVNRTTGATLVNMRCYPTPLTSTVGWTHDRMMMDGWMASGDGWWLYDGTQGSSRHDQTFRYWSTSIVCSNPPSISVIESREWDIDTLTVRMYLLNNLIVIG